jgi:hypothetical protein
MKYDIIGIIWSEETCGYFKYIFLVNLYVICNSKNFVMP